MFSTSQIGGTLLGGIEEEMRQQEREDAELYEEGRIEALKNARERNCKTCLCISNLVVMTGLVLAICYAVVKFQNC